MNISNTLHFFIPCNRLPNRFVSIINNYIVLLCKYFLSIFAAFYFFDNHELNN